MKVLLVDDEKKFISILAKRLAMREIDADWTCSGEEALEKARQCRYDISLLDVKMPRIGGIELKRMLHELQPEMKFIFITGHGSVEDFTIGSNEASFYMVKPLKIDQVIEKIKEALKA